MHPVQSQAQAYPSFSSSRIVSTILRIHKAKLFCGVKQSTKQNKNTLKPHEEWSRYDANENVLGRLK